jgi:hypothetical protein
MVMSSCERYVYPDLEVSTAEKLPINPHRERKVKEAENFDDQSITPDPKENF